MEKGTYIIEAARQEDEGIGLIDIAVKDAETGNCLGTVVVMDSLRSHTEEKDVTAFSPRITYTESRTEEGGLTEEELLAAVFPFLEEKGAEELEYCTTKKRRPPFLKALGFNLEQTNMASYFPIYHYRKDLLDLD